MIINHPIIHAGPPLLGLFAMALIGGLAGGAITALLLYAKGKVVWVD